MEKTIERQYRGRLFRHLDGLVTVPTAQVLSERGVLKYILEHRSVSLEELSDIFTANDGYLNVALRVLASQGWLTQETKEGLLGYGSNTKTKYALQHLHMYRDAYKLLDYFKDPSGYTPGPQLLGDMKKVLDRYHYYLEMDFLPHKEHQEIHEQMMAHIEGVMVAPLSVYFKMEGFFDRCLSSENFNPNEFQEYFSIFEKLGWFEKHGEYAHFTEKGCFFAKRAYAYGVTTSYMPTLTHLDDLIFGNAMILQGVNSQERERHVNRVMNVRASGAIHSFYFKLIMDALIEIFNKPIDQQPQGILDMGCGDGSLLIHMFEVIKNETLRGRVLDEHPLVIVGADYNKAALDTSRRNMDEYNIPATIVWGDIGDPRGLAERLDQNYDIQLGELLQVRTFLDHNRIWKEPKKSSINGISNSTGAFAFQGRRIVNNKVEASLLEHLQSWAPYTKYGILMIELHTVNPLLVSKHLGETSATAYDATHGYSDQYIIEHNILQKVAKKVGLVADQGVFKKFPESELATVSINLFKRKRD